LYKAIVSNNNSARLYAAFSNKRKSTVSHRTLGTTVLVCAVSD